MLPDSIKTKQMILAVILAIVPLVVAGYVLNQIASETIRSSVESKLRQITHDKVEAIRQWMHERRADIILLSESEELQALYADPDNEQRRLAFIEFYDFFSEQYGTYSWVYLRNNEGKEILLHPESIYQNLLPEFETSQTSEVSISHAIEMRDNAYFFMSVPVRNEGRQQGLLTVGVRLEMLNKITDNINVGETGEAYIVDSRGYFLTHQDRSLVLNKDYSDVGIIRKLISGDEQTFVGQVIDYRGVPVLGAYYYMPELEWGLVAEQDVAEAFQPLHRFTRAVILILVITIIIASLLASVLTSRNLKPLNQLTETIREIESGNLGTRFPVTRDDEISQTGQLFNTMLDELESNRAKLQKKVEAADKDLRKAHEELQQRHRELKQAQERLLHSERLSTMGEIAAGLAHEINNPLSTINMLIFSLKSGVDSDPAERDQIIEIISEEISKIAELIERFQDLTQPVKIEKEPVVIERVIDRSLTLVRPRLEKDNIRCRVDVDDNLPVFYGDERHLGQMLLNLLLNSIGAMKGGGEIDISVHPCRDEVGKEWICMKLRDTGTGISMEDLDNVFKPFFTTKAEGTGLGLLNVRKIVDEHGGTITVESEPGTGTTFTMMFPQHGAGDAE